MEEESLYSVNPFINFKWKILGFNLNYNILFVNNFNNSKFNI